MYIQTVKEGVANRRATPTPTIILQPCQQVHAKVMHSLHSLLASYIKGLALLSRAGCWLRNRIVCYLPPPLPGRFWLRGFGF